MMNAGAYGGEMKQVLESVAVMTPEGEVKTLREDELELGYRTSIVAKKNYIVLEAVIRLEPGDAGDIRSYMEELKEKRVSKQPSGIPQRGEHVQTAGGVFCRQADRGCRTAGISV